MTAKVMGKLPPPDESDQLVLPSKNPPNRRRKHMYQLSMAPLCSPDVIHVDTTTNSSFELALMSDEVSVSLDLQCQLNKLTVSSKRRVVFSQEQDRILNPQTEYYTDEDISTKWWSMQDLANIREEAKSMSALLRHHARKHDCDLTMAHRKTTLILASDFHSLIKLSPTSPDQDLANWCSYEDGRRGLERFSSKVYHSFRRKDVTDSRRAIIEEQQRQRLLNISDTEAIAKASAKYSRRARNFALFFGGADAKQVLKRDLQQAPARRAPPRKRSKMCHSIDRSFSFR